MTTTLRDRIARIIAEIAFGAANGGPTCIQDKGRFVDRWALESYGKDADRIIAELGMGWKPISESPIEEGQPFEVWWKSGLDGWIPVTVSWFEGNLYPSFRGGSIDWEDRIECATHWRPIVRPAPEVDHG